TFSDDGTACVWDAATGQPITPPLRHDAIGEKYPLAPGFAFSPDERWLVTAGQRGAQVWTIATGQPAGPLLPHKAPVNHAPFSSDGRRIVTASDDHTVALWSVPHEAPNSPAPLQSWRHPSAVKGAWFSPDGQRVATVCDDWTATVWQLDKKESLWPPIKR